MEETEYLRHVRFDKPVVIKMDGKKSLGVVLKPESKMINKENVNVLKLLCHDLLGTDYTDKFIFFRVIHA